MRKITVKLTCRVEQYLISKQKPGVMLPCLRKPGPGNRSSLFLDNDPDGYRTPSDLTLATGIWLAERRKAHRCRLDQEHAAVHRQSDVCEHGPEAVDAGSSPLSTTFGGLSLDSPAFVVALVSGWLHILLLSQGSSERFYCVSGYSVVFDVSPDGSPSKRLCVV